MFMNCVPHRMVRICWDTRGFPLAKCQISTSNQAITTLFYNIFNQLFFVPQILKAIWSELMTVSLNKVGRFPPSIGHEGPQGEQRYSSTLFLTSALEGGEGSASRPGRNLPPGKTRYPLYTRLGVFQGRSGQVRKISPPPGFDPRTVQPVGSRYTDYATRPTLNKVRGTNI